MRITKGRVLTALLAAVMLTGCGAAKEATTNATPTAPPTSSSAPAPSETPWSPEPSESSPSASTGIGAWGSTAGWEGLDVKVGRPYEVRPGDWSIGHEPGHRIYAFKVTITNTGSEPFDAALFTITASSGAEGSEAESVLDVEKGLDLGFEGSVLPGRSKTATFGFDVDSGESKVSLEVSPGMEYESAFYEGTVGR